MMNDVFNKLHCLKNNKLLIVFPSVVSPGGILAYLACELPFASPFAFCLCATFAWARQWSCLLQSEGSTGCACATQQQMRALLVTIVLILTFAFK